MCWAPQGSWTPASGSLGPQHLEEPASLCGCGWGPPSYPRVQESTFSCERARSAQGQNPGLARAMGGWIPLVFVLGLGGAQINSARSAQVPLGKGLVSCAGCAALQEGQCVEAGHSGSSAPLTFTHPVGDSLSSLLPVTPGYSMGHPGF